MPPFCIRPSSSHDLRQRSRSAALKSAIICLTCQRTSSDMTRRIQLRRAPCSARRSITQTGREQGWRLRMTATGRPDTSALWYTREKFVQKRFNCLSYSFNLLQWFWLQICVQIFKVIVRTFRIREKVGKRWNDQNIEIYSAEGEDAQNALRERQDSLK